MRSKNETLLSAIEKFVSDYSDAHSYSPSFQEIADGVGVSLATAHRYVMKLNEDGALEYLGRRRVASSKNKSPVVRVPILGSIACGIPKFAVENIEEYVKLPVSLFGSGDFFLLKAYGDSMIEAGIDDGDLVLIRQQNSAEEGQIVVALVDDEATLKRYYPEPKQHRIRLHPENLQMDDIYVDNCEIQGIAVKVFKDLV